MTDTIMNRDPAQKITAPLALFLLCALAALAFAHAVTLTVLAPTYMPYEHAYRGHPVRFDTFSGAYEAYDTERGTWVVITPITVER